MKKVVKRYELLSYKISKSWGNNVQHVLMLQVMFH